MATRVMVYLGLVSYGVFLWNLQVLGKLNGRGAGDWLPIGTYWSLLVVGLAATTIVATGSWYLIEKPALSLKGRVRRRRREVSVERAA
jgi:peptidoglycan/LPS O-acetylase OafA/YrhL